MKWNEKADKARFEEHCLLQAVAAGFEVDEQRILALEEKGFIDRKTVFSINERGIQRLTEISNEILKVAKER